MARYHASLYTMNIYYSFKIPKLVNIARITLYQCKLEQKHMAQPFLVTKISSKKKKAQWLKVNILA